MVARYIYIYNSASSDSNLGTINGSYIMVNNDVRLSYIDLTNTFNVKLYIWAIL